MKHLWQFSLVIGLAFLLSPVSLRAQRPAGRPSGGTIDVQVRYATGEPGPRDLHLRLESAEGGPAGDCQTREGGKCQFNLPSSGVYLVRMAERGYKEVTVRVELIGMSHGYATLELSPISGPAPPQPPKSASGHAASAVGLGVPDNARQEYEKGESSLEQHKLNASVGHFRKAVQLYETFPEAYERLGSAYLQQQNWTESQTALQRAIQLDPKLAQASLELGAVFNQTREYSKAEAALMHGLELSPDSSMGHYELAKTLWALGRWQDAAPHAVAAVAAMPDLAAPHVLLANILLRKHDVDGALREYQTYLRLEPNGSMAAGTRDVIEKIKSSRRK